MFLSQYTIFALLLLFVTIPQSYVQASSAVCYLKGGVARDTYSPCSNGTDSTCCADGSTCMSNGLCNNACPVALVHGVCPNAGNGTIYRGGCLDPNFKAPGCEPWCPTVSTVGAAVWDCGNNKYCCGTVSSCCTTPTSVFTLAAATPFATAGVSIADAVSTTSSPSSVSTSHRSSLPSSSTVSRTGLAGATVTSAPTTSPTSSPINAASSSSLAVKVGTGIGVPLGIALLAGLIWLALRYRKRKKKAGSAQEIVHEEKYKVGGGYNSLQDVHEPVELHGHGRAELE